MQKYRKPPMARLADRRTVWAMLRRVGAYPATMLTSMVEGGEITVAMKRDLEAVGISENDLGRSLESFLDIIRKIATPDGIIKQIDSLDSIDDPNRCALNRVVLILGENGRPAFFPITLEPFEPDA